MEHLRSRYQEFVAGIDWPACQARAHREIYQFHLALQDQNIAHVMFNGNSYFESEPYHYNWHNCYIGPYDRNKTYDFVLRQQGFATVNPDSWHFGADAHCFWGEYLLQYIKANNLLPTQ